MADNAATELKNLNERLLEVNKTLKDNENISKNFATIFRKAVQDSGMSVEQLLQSLQSKKLDANKIRLILSLTDENGKTLTAKTLQDQIKKITDELEKPNYKKDVKVGFDIMSLKEAEKMLPQLRQMLSLAKTEGGKLWQDVMKISNASIGSNKKESTEYGRALASNMNARRNAINDIARTEGKILQLEQELGRYKEGSKNWERTKARIDEASKSLEIYKQKLALIATKGKDVLGENITHGDYNKETKQIIQQGREATREAERLSKVRQKDAEWQEQQRRNTEAQYTANGKAIEQQRRLADQIDQITRKRELLIRSNSSQGIASMGNRDLALMKSYESQIKNLKLLREQLERQFVGSTKAGDSLFLDTKILRDKEAAQKRAAEAATQQARADKEAERAARALREEEERIAKVQRDVRVRESKAAYQQQSRAEKEAVANMRRQIQIKQRLAELDHNRVLNKGRRTESEVNEYKLLNRELTGLIQRQKELNNISRGATAKAKGATDAYYWRTQTKEAERYEKQLERLRNQMMRTDDTFGKMTQTALRFASAFGMAFSVQGLVQFGKKLIETRGNFEMQFVAIKQIIGDVDEATRIWNQTMQLALNSPFTAMQLTDYTKKLAAYRIETDKLFDTTKRLADVSAGLGVDMQRLILAYGQVKAANYLRASEIRQFTEAGVNILGELSKYLTEVNEKMITTADVMEMVSKRKVTFEDVEAIFKRMTDEGGVFYNMQEVQAQTVRGQIMKLHDAYEQMLNTIGESNQGTLMSLVDTLNSMVRNWKDIAVFLQSSIGGFVLFGTMSKLLTVNMEKYGATLIKVKGVAKGTFEYLEAARVKEILLLNKSTGAITKWGYVSRMAIFKVKMAWVTLRNLFRSFAPLLIIEGISAIVTAIVNANRVMDDFIESTNKLATETIDSIKANKKAFAELRDEIEKTNQETEARRQAVEKMNNQFGQYLNNLVTEKMTVEELRNAYAGVEEKLTNIANLKLRESVRNEQKKSVQNLALDMISDIENEDIWGGVNGGEELLRKDAISLVENYTNAIEEAVRQKGKGLTEKELQQLAVDVYNEYLGANLKGYNPYIDILSDMVQRGTTMSEIFAQDIPATGFKTAEDAEKWHLGVVSWEKYLEVKQKMFDDTKKDLEEKITDISELRKKMNDLIEKYDKETKKYADDLAKKYGFSPNVSSFFGEKYGVEPFDEKEVAQNTLNLEKIYRTKGLAELKKLFSTNGEFYEYSDEYAAAAKIILASTEDLAKGSQDYEKATKEAYKTEKEYLDWLKSKKDVTDDQLKKQELLIKFYEIWAKIRDIDLNEKKKQPRGGGQKDSASRYLSLVKELRSEYDKLSKSAYGLAKSERIVRESYNESIEAILGKAGVSKDFDFTTTEGTTKALEIVKNYLKAQEKAGKVTKDAWKDVQKYIDQLQTDREINIQVRIREDFGKKIEEAFGDYELSLELQKVNLSKDVLSDLFDVDSVSLSDLRRKVAEFYNERLAVEADPTELVKQVEEYYKKIDDLERKQQRDRIKDYAKYLEYELSERAKIEMEYTRKVAEVASNQAFTKEQKDQINKHLKEERDKAVAKQEWEDFKGSETYIQMMEDLEHQGTNALLVMRTELERIRENAENLSPRALKEVVNALEKIDEITIRRGMPISNIISAAGAVNSARVSALETGLSWDQVSSRQAARQTQADIKAQLLPMEQQYKLLQSQLGAEKEINRLEQERYDNGLKLNELLGESFMTGDNAYIQELLQNNYSNIEGGETRIKELQEQRNTASEEESKEIDKKLEAEEANLNCLKAEKALLEKQLELNIAIAKAELARAATPEERASLQARIDAMEEELNKLREQDVVVGNLTKKYGILGDSETEAVKKLAQYAQQVVDTFSSFKNMMTALGVDTDTDAWDDMTTAFETLGTVASTAGSMATKIAQGDYVGAAIDGVKGIMDVVSMWAGNNDNKLEREIRKQQERIDNLTRAYERLEKQIEKTYNTASYMGDYASMVANLNQQIAATRAQLAAEQDKKNSDDDKINGYKDSLEDLYDELDKVAQKQIEVFGGIGAEGYRDAAEGFVDAWKSAFLETGDGLEALQDHFDEFLQEWFVKQATMRIAGNMLKPVFEQIDKAVEKDSMGGANVTLEELQRVRDLWATIAPDLNDALTNLAGMWDLNGEGSLSGLAAGIQGMTEEQANILEAYWNSVRIYTANIDQNVSRIADILGAGGVNTNPQLEELQSIRNKVNQIYDLFSPMDATAGSATSGHGLRVYVANA